MDPNTFFGVLNCI